MTAPRGRGTRSASTRVDAMIRRPTPTILDTIGQLLLALLIGAIIASWGR